VGTAGSIGKKWGADDVTTVTSGFILVSFNATRSLLAVIAPIDPNTISLALKLTTYLVTELRFCETTKRVPFHTSYINDATSGTAIPRGTHECRCRIDELWIEQFIANIKDSKLTLMFYLCVPLCFMSLHSSHWLRAPVIMKAPVFAGSSSIDRCTRLW
jgi:hypothetical protein